MRFQRLRGSDLPDQVKSESINRLTLEQRVKSRVNHLWV